MPFTEFKASDIKFRPDVVAKDIMSMSGQILQMQAPKKACFSVALIINENSR